TFPEAELWPEERPTWNSAAVLLAADAICGTSRTAGLFKHAERAHGRGLLELPGGQRPPEDVERRLTALRRPREDVVDDEEAASRPASCSARPSDSGMNPMASLAARRRWSSISAAARARRRRRGPPSATGTARPGRPPGRRRRRGGAHARRRDRRGPAARSRP